MASAHWSTMLWYSLLTGLAGRLRHPRAAAHLRVYRRALGLHYHGLGGNSDGDVVVGAGARRALVGGVHRGGDLLAWPDRDQMHLPDHINRFPTCALNRELYFWLAAYFAFEHAPDGKSALPAGLSQRMGSASLWHVPDSIPSR